MLSRCSANPDRSVASGDSGLKFIVSELGALLAANAVPHNAANVRRAIGASTAWLRQNHDFAVAGN